MSLNRPAMIFTSFIVASATLIITAPPFFPSGTLPIQPQRHTALIREIRGSTATSNNWSGYTVTGSKDSFAGASGSWMVPTLICGAKDAYSATWVGIDGWISNAVQQIGTESDCINGKASNYAWYEFYPHNFFTIENVPISPGDPISASVEYSGGKFIVSLADANVNPNAPFTISTKMPQAQRKSAECIVEAVYSGGVLPLANFGTEQFNCSAATGSILMPFGSFPAADVVAITMITKNGATKAVPSALAGSSFSDSWVEEGP